MKALVLGGNGFIGSHIVDRLLSVGHSVRVFDRAPDHFRVPLSGVDYRIGSFDDVAALAEALEGVDVVYHLISTTVPSTSNRDPIYDVESNLLSTLRLLNLMRDQEVPRIAYLSSGGTVYGIPESSPIPETHPLRPICSYGVVKVAIENYLHMYHKLYGLKYVILRASNPYGERQGHMGVQGVIGTFMKKINEGEVIEIWGDGSVVRDYIYVGDLAELCVAVIETSEVGVYNAGSGVGCSVNEIVEKLAEISNKAIKPKYLAGRGYDVPSVVLDVSKARKLVGWAQRTALADGLSLTWGRMSG